MLAKHAAFSKLEQEQLEALGRRGRKRLIASGTIIMDKGDESKHMYLLLKGSMRVERHARGKVPHLVANLSRGEIVGEVGLLHGALHSSTVRAVDEVVALELTKREVQQAFREHPSLREAFMRMIHHRLHVPEHEDFHRPG